MKTGPGYGTVSSSDIYSKSWSGTVISMGAKMMEEPFTVIVTNATDASSKAKAVLPDDGSRDCSNVDYLKFSQSCTFQRYPHVHVVGLVHRPDAQYGLGRG